MKQETYFACQCFQADSLNPHFIPKDERQKEGEERGGRKR